MIIHLQRWAFRASVVAFALAYVGVAALVPDASNFFTAPVAGAATVVAVLFVAFVLRGKLEVVPKGGKVAVTLRRRWAWYGVGVIATSWGLYFYGACGKTPLTDSALGLAPDADGFAHAPRAADRSSEPTAAELEQRTFIRKYLAAILRESYWSVAHCDVAPGVQTTAVCREHIDKVVQELRPKLLQLQAEPLVANVYPDILSDITDVLMITGFSDTECAAWKASCTALTIAAIECAHALWDSVDEFKPIDQNWRERNGRVPVAHQPLPKCVDAILVVKGVEPEPDTEVGR